MCFKRYIDVFKEVQKEHGPTASLSSTVFTANPATPLYFHLYTTRSNGASFVAYDINYAVKLKFYATAFDWVDN